MKIINNKLLIILCLIFIFENKRKKSLRKPKHSINGYSGMPFLVANVELKKPFTNLDQFKAYLQEHNLPSRELFDEENNPRFGFAENAYSSDAFYADFYQPQRLR